MSSLTISQQIQANFSSLQNRVSANWKGHNVEVITALAVASAALALACAAYVLAAGMAALLATGTLAGVGVGYTAFQLFKHPVEALESLDGLKKIPTPLLHSPMAKIEDVEEVEEEKKLDEDAQILDLQEMVDSPKKDEEIVSMPAITWEADLLPVEQDRADAPVEQPVDVPAFVEQDKVDAPVEQEKVDAPAEQPVDETLAPVDQETVDAPVNQPIDDVLAPEEKDNVETLAEGQAQVSVDAEQDKVDAPAEEPSDVPASVEQDAAIEPAQQGFFATLKNVWNQLSDLEPLDV